MSMIRKLIFITLFIFCFAWIVFFRLKPENFLLIINIKKLTPVSPVYYLKIAREKLQSIFIMGNRDSAEWNFILSQKRALESQILCDHKLFDIGKKQLLLANKYYEEGSSYLIKLIDVIDTNYLQQEQEKAKILINTTCK